MLKLTGVTFLILVEASFSLASSNLWDALATDMGIDPSGPAVAPSYYEGKLCSQPDIVCYTCEQFNEDPVGCTSRPECVFDCYYYKCKDMEDPSLIHSAANCTTQCYNPCGCQLYANCFYSEWAENEWIKPTPQCVTAESSPGLDETNFRTNECYRGSKEPYEYYYSRGKLSPLVNQDDKGPCEVEKIAGEYIREFEGAFDHDRSHPCVFLSSAISDTFGENPSTGETFGFFELVVVFDKLDDWLPAGKHRVFSLSIFNAAKMSLTLRRNDFPDAEKIKIYWNFIMGSRSTNAYFPYRYLQVKALKPSGYYLRLDLLEISLCDQALNSCFKENGVVRPASVTLNKFKPERYSKSMLEPLKMYTASSRQKALHRASA